VINDPESAIVLGDNNPGSTVSSARPGAPGIKNRQREDWRERRSDHRYEIDATFEYTLRPDQDAPAVGRGRVMNISRSGILVELIELIPANAEIELSIEWPVRRNRVIPVCMWILGRTIRTQNHCTAVQILSYEFPREDGART
jgi:hypothetical protein